MSNDEVPATRAGEPGSFGFLFSHDEGAGPVETTRGSRHSTDEAGPGRPLEMRFSGDGEDDSGKRGTAS